MNNKLIFHRFVFLVSLLYEEFLLFFWWLASFWWFFFIFFNNTWISHYRQLQIVIMIFNKKTVVNISSISDLKNLPWNLLSFVSRIVVNECLKNSVRNYFSLLWFQIIGKTIKTLGFHSNTHLLDLSMSPCVIQRRIQNPVKHLRGSVLWK